MKTVILTIWFVVLLWMAAIAIAMPVNSNAVVLDDIEYYIQTDKAVYNLGQDVQMLYRITNLGDEDVTFILPNYPVWNFWVEKDGENIWTAVGGWHYTITEFTLSPGVYREFPDSWFYPPYIWHMRDDENNLINIGEYDVIGGLDGGTVHYDTIVAVPINVVPEPASFLLFALAGLFLRIGSDSIKILSPKPPPKWHW